MLTVNFETDANTVAALCRDLGIEECAGGADFVLREDGVPVGLMRVKIGDFAEITHFKVKNEEINPGDREFFLRAMLFKFSLNPVPLAVKGRHAELEKFGFRYEDGYMRLCSSDVNLSGNCGGAE